ncbi:hypothetical protein DCAR_0310158 [Daucus carota subsp. sativus]|uniref:Glycine-rich protein n=1 Tax=Daucus carota subsp. sativus TaxID=79200 RepID=A0A162AF55_DAUCS|nr:hypothetical protein DCAR_0310158 [Daucus carota subsp. sativus]
MGSKILLLLALSIAFTFLISSQVAARDLAETTLKTETASLDGSSYYAGGVGGSRSHPAASAYSRGGGSHHNGDGETYKAIPIGGGCYNRYECN